MEVQFLSAAALGITLMAVSPVNDATSGADSLLGARIFASETHIDRWGDPVPAESLELETLGTVTEIAPTPGSDAGAVLVSVGGLWGWGAQEVEVSLNRIHVLESAAGTRRLIVDLSVEGDEPVSG